MDREIFAKKFEEVKADGQYGKRKKAEIQELTRQHMLLLGQTNIPVGYQELFIATEELAELIQSVTKVLRGKCDYGNLVEELADVMVSLNYIETVLDVNHDDVEIALEVKLRKLESLIQEARERDIGLHDNPGKELL